LEHLNEPYRSVVLKLLEELLKIFNDKLISVVVFGSVARGTPRRDSDLDLLIIAEDLPRHRLRRTEIYLKAEEKLDPLLEKLMKQGYVISISPIIKTREEAMNISPLYLDMVEDAIIVYDKDGFFQEILDKLREKLKDRERRRKKLIKSILINPLLSTASPTHPLS